MKINQRAQPARSHESGAGLISQIVLAAIIMAIVAGVFHRIDLKQDYLSRLIRKDEMGLKEKAVISRVAQVFEPTGSSCDQPSSVFDQCPSLFPEPLNCDKFKFKNFEPGFDWTYNSWSSLSTHFVNRGGSTPAAGTLDRSNQSRKQGSLGEITFNLGNLRGAMNASELQRLFSSRLDHSSLSGRNPLYKFAIDGIDCGPNNMVSGVYLTNEESAKKDPNVTLHNIRVPINIPPPSCALSLSQSVIDEGKAVDVKVVALGAWDAIWAPNTSGSPSVYVANDETERSITAGHLAWEGSVVPKFMGACSWYGYVQATISGPGGTSSCSGAVRIDPTDPDHFKSCAQATSVSWTPPPAKNESEFIKSCPKPYFIKDKGREYLMTYIVHDGECVAVKGKT